MKTAALLNSFLAPVVNLANYYQQQREREKSLTNKYRVVSTLEDYQNTNLIQLAFTDNPGDFLRPLPIEKIKKTPDLIAGMHPIDINSINDLYYLSRDQIIEIRVEGDEIIAIKKDGNLISYNVSAPIDLTKVQSIRLSYMIGYMQGEKLQKEAYASILANQNSYKIIADNITTLEIKDLNSNKSFLKNPLDILYSEDYKKFSKKDICRIGYICGQMSKI